MITEVPISELAVNGGPKVRTKPFPGRGLIGPDDKAAVDKLFDESIVSGHAFGYYGPNTEAYCNEIAEFMGGGYAVAVNSGTSAVYVSLRALDIEPFTEVIVPPMTDSGGFMPVVMLNCIPVVADSAPGMCCPGPEEIEAVISPLTSAIVVAHIGGMLADMEGIIKVADKHGIPVVEDCAQAHYAKLNGRLAGTFGAFGAFSTMYGKHMCTGGQGGFIFTQDEELYKMARRSADRGKPFFMSPDSTNCIASLNFNMDEMSAAIGRVQLRKLPAIVERRRRTVEKLTSTARHMPSINIPPTVPGAESSYWYWMLELNLDRLMCDRDMYCSALSAEGIPAINNMPHYLVHTCDWYKNRRVFGTSGYPWASPDYSGDRNREYPTPNAREVASNRFIILVEESWDDEEIDDTIRALNKVESAYIR